MNELDQIREYWDARPCNVRHSPAQVGSRQFFDDVTRRRYLVEPHIRGFAEFERWKGKRVLEVGCGIGTDAEQFVRAGAHYTGVELSGESMALAVQRFQTYGLHGTFRQGNAEELPDFVEPEPYDLVYCWGVLHHTPDPEQVVEHVQQYMRAESEFRLMVYATNSWKRAMIDAGFDQPEAQADCPLARTYTAESIRKLLDAYHVEDIHQDHIFPYQVEPYKLHRYARQPWFENMPDEMLRVLERNFGWHLLVRATL